MRWNITANRLAIEWKLKENELHTDDIEMSGDGCSVIVKYGMNENGFVLGYHPVYPTLRLRPNDTHASFQLDVPDEFMPRMLADGEPIAEKLQKVRINGTLELYTAAHGLEITHICYPSPKSRAAHEKVTIKNVGDRTVELTPTTLGGRITHVLGPMGINIAEVITDVSDKTLEAGESFTYYISVCGRLTDETSDPTPAADLSGRRRRAMELMSPMKLDTGDEIIDTMFAFAKLRAGESVFDTKFGPVHSPGGKSYYAATWCNDQVEYAGPYFAYTGDERLLEASMNAYRMYIPFMSEDYEPIPSSVIAEGLDFWNGAGDRGDAAMYLYGASRFVMTAGRADWAKELLPAIEWCAEYCRRKINENGVVASDSDELENRFPSGNANLCTSTLAYDGYRSAAMLEREIGSEELADEYDSLAAGLKAAIGRFFGVELHGYDCYRYYEECEKLRSWICMPLCVGIFDRAEGTVGALCSEELMKPDGMLTEEGSTTIWDRSTLYSLRGIFAAGKTEKAYELLERFSANRLLGERVPYSVEAYPEGGRRHLSGESALYCKVILEGLLDMRPLGLGKFSLKPTLPGKLDHLYLRGIEGSGAIFDVLLDKEGFKVVRGDGEVLAKGRNGEYVEVTV